MLQALILGVGLLIGLLLIATWFVNADPKSVARSAKWVGGFLALVLAVYLLITGRLGIAMAVLAFLIPTLMRARGMLSRMRSAGGPTPGQQSDLRTDSLDVALDHDTGEMDGVVLRGLFEGRRLSQMGEADLRRLLEELEESDPQSAQILTAYLDRRFGAEWQEDEAGARRDAGGAGAGPAGMTREEAYGILELEPGADAEAIKAAHRRLMKKFHPDQGGSAYFAAKLNQAKEILLKS